MSLDLALSLSHGNVSECNTNVYLIITISKRIKVYIQDNT